MIQISEDTLMLRYGLYYHPTIALRAFDWLPTLSLSFLSVLLEHNNVRVIFFPKKETGMNKGFGLFILESSHFHMLHYSNVYEAYLGFFSTLWESNMIFRRILHLDPVVR